MRIMLKSKIHRAHITATNIEYEGSITIDRELLAAADILPYEQVEVLNVNNGARFTTYAGEGEKGEMGINGAAARLAVERDIVLILTYQHVTEEEVSNHLPKLVYVDAENTITRTKNAIESVTI